MEKRRHCVSAPRAGSSRPRLTHGSLWTTRLRSLNRGFARSDRRYQASSDELRVPIDPPRFFGRLRAECALCSRAGRPSAVAWIYCSTKDAVLNSTVHPTQRRLMIALIVTLACLPLLVLDMFQGSTTSGATETAGSSSESSLVVAVVPSTEDTTPATTSVSVITPETVVIPSTTLPVPVAPRVAPTTTSTLPRPVVTAAPVVQSDEAFMACVRHRESRGNYGAADPSGTFLGAYQIYQGGWDSVAGRIGRHDLVGVPPNQASPPDQDAVAFAMLQFHGRAPWGGSCG